MGGNTSLPKESRGEKFLLTRKLLCGWRIVLWLRGVGAETRKDLQPETLLFPREVVCTREGEYRRTLGLSPMGDVG